MATTAKRVPRSVEIRMRRRLDDAVAEYLSQAVASPDLMPSDFARDAFRDLEGEDLDVIVQPFVDIIVSINELNCVAYGVAPDLVEKYHRVKTGGGPHTLDLRTSGLLHKSQRQTLDITGNFSANAILHERCINCFPMSPPSPSSSRMSRPRSKYRPRRLGASQSLRNVDSSRA
ncbi:hypothetical protein MPL3356_250029 [Mesorhizobium plurifarium]|uniref:Uncharacterized protein n=1 Tax=Mesorhizobium plurifarium TaxID=69974 RepID=A0A090DTH9_MESPL|nr:hypothetical protein MPL3356_250029 [Mesorhizobium plurifarium]